MGPYRTSQIVDRECCQDNLYKLKQSKSPESLFIVLCNHYQVKSLNISLKKCFNVVHQGSATQSLHSQSSYVRLKLTSDGHNIVDVVVTYFGLTQLRAHPKDNQKPEPRGFINFWRHLDTFVISETLDFLVLSFMKKIFSSFPSVQR